MESPENKEKDKCYRCGRIVPDGYMLPLCPKCLEKYNERHESEDTCNTCGREIDEPEFKTCSSCRQIRTETWKKLDETKPEYLCRSCFSRRRLPERRLCEVCTVGRKKGSAKRSNRKKAEESTENIISLWESLLVDK